MSDRVRVSAVGPESDPPPRQVRASYDEQTIRVYQAYAPAIAEPAVAAGTFVAPFGMGRMTWIKPSFLWMMYRCGWARKPGQERVLAVTLRRAGFEAALEQACLSHFEAGTYADHAAWEARRDATSVRVQWDPERSPTLAPLPWRSLQVGLSGAAVRSYVEDWIVGIEDVTAYVHEVEAAGERRAELLPVERPYPLPARIGAVIGAS